MIKIITKEDIEKVINELVRFDAADGIPWGEYVRVVVTEMPFSGERARLMPEVGVELTISDNVTEDGYSEDEIENFKNRLSEKIMGVFTGNKY